MLSPNLATILASEKGKYWRWAKRLNADNLEALLWAIGEFGTRLAAARLPGDTLPVPQFYPHWMAGDRMRDALMVLVTIQSVGRVTWEHGPFAQLSEHASAFSLEYREHLSKDAHTAWAQGLDERNLGILLWMVGEYGVRVNSSRGPDGGDYPPPTFDRDPETEKQVSAALRVIAKIERGESMTAAQARRLIAGTEV